MRATVTLVAEGRGSREDAVIEAPAATTSGELVARLARLVDADHSGIAPVLLDGSPLESMTPLATSALRDGAILSFDTAPAQVATPRGYLELRVVGGPAAGSVHPVGRGETTIGRGSGSSVRLDDPDVSRHHAVLTATADTITIADAGSTNGTVLDGKRVGRTPEPISPGMRLRIGESTLILAAPDEPPVALSATLDGHLAYNRPPRLATPQPATTIAFPVRPQEKAPTRLPVIATLTPVAVGVLLALVMKQPEFLLFTVLSPVMMAGQWLADRVGFRRTDHAERAAYDLALKQTRRELAAALRAEEAERRRLAPDPAALLKIVTAPSARLWERRRADPDFLRVRLGAGTLPANTRASDAGAEPTVNDVPVTLDLGSIGVLGIAGPPARIAALARALIGQLAGLHSPRDVSLVLLTETSRAGEWEWIRWLPHLSPIEPANCQALVGLDPGTVGARVGELCALVAARRQQATSDASRHRRTIVVVLDGARALRDTPGLTDVLAQGPDADVLAICLDTGESRLPEECGAVVTFTGDVATRLRLRVSGTPVTTDAIADGVCLSWADRVARALAPLRDTTSGAGAEALPGIVRWVDIAGLDNPRIEVRERWRRSTGGSTAALVGTGIDGPFSIDIAKDGPHALVAGTTGSGKSELLQTLVASLAVANRPDELTFVLVDYKGGAAFGACAGLPHTVGLVTDLDGALVERALTSLTAELKRREVLLAATGATNIDDYRGSGRGLARLVIVVDEFASLAEELPDFVGGLVGIAQRGRSLGVHLLLATQRPEGVVSADIRANTNLRICLAVMRDAESRDVLDAPDAARISRSTPGRGYVRTGHGELHPFQSGRVGGAARAHEAERIEVRRAPFRALGHPAPVLPMASSAASSATDLDRIVAACREAAEYLHIETPVSPWLAPLGTAEVAPAEPGRPLAATLGVRDVPERQAREPYVVDLTSTGHLVIAGSARSGRSTALRSLAGLLARSTSVSDLHVYAFDCAGGSLGALAGLPHCGAIVTTHEPERARRLVALLAGELIRRQQILATNGFGSLDEQRATGLSPLPHVVVLLDGWEAFVSAFDDVDAGAIVDGIFRLLHEGAAAGIHVVATADRAGLVGRLASTVEHRLVLRLADRTDFALAGIPVRAVPANLPAGRGFLASDHIETQLCLLDSDPYGAAQLRALSDIAVAATARDAHFSRDHLPRRVDPLPTRIGLDAASTGRPTPIRGSAAIVVGVGGDELGAVQIDLLETGPGFVIAGPSRSGRSSTLATVAVGLRRNGWRVVLVTARPTPASAFADAVFDARDPGFDAATREPAEPLAVLVDDAELVTETPAAGTLDRFIRSARDAGYVVVIAGTTDDLSVGFRGFVVDARRSRTGVLLTPRSSLDGEVLGVRLPRDTGGSRLPPGRGLLVSRGESTALQAALPE